jgi:hypothetical protein
MNEREQREQAANEAFGCFLIIVIGLILLGGSLVWGFGYGCLMAAGFMIFIVMASALGGRR